MPQELPGFYYDPEKNRYFPIKGRIPGSSSQSHNPSSSNSKLEQLQETCQQSTLGRNEFQTSKMLQQRELYGYVLSSKKSKFNFQHEYQKREASKPMIWKIRNTERSGDGALEHLCIDIQTPEGQGKRNFLLVGHKGSSLKLYEVMQEEERLEYGFHLMPDPIWPSITADHTACVRAPKLVWIPAAQIPVTSTVSSIKAVGKHCPRTADAGSSIHHALISTLGSETSGGSIYIMKLNEPIHFTLRRRTSKIASLPCTIWTAECHPDGSQAVIGTDRGAALLNLETGGTSWLCLGKSDIFSQQFNQLGNVVLCGFRNGAIVTVDVRQKRQGFADVLPRHQIPICSYTGDTHSSRKAQKRTNRLFKLKGSIHPSSTIFMPSSISRSSCMTIA